VARFRTQKTAALLGFLAFHGENAHPRDGLMELLWPRAKLGAARSSLSHALSSLRRQLEPPGVARGSVIVADRFLVQLNPLAATTDVRELEAALASAARASGSERASRLAGAVALYRGELLAGFDEAWLAPERERLAATFTRVARQLAADDRRDGAVDRALDLLRRATAASPFDEPAHRDLMVLLAESGQPLAAARHYQELARTFKREVSRLPSPETSELARRLEREARAPRPPGPRAPGEGPPRAAPPAAAPFPVAGTVTFLAVAPEAGRAAALREVFASLVAKQGGEPRPASEASEAEEERSVGAFSRPSDALACALALQRAAGLAASGSAPPGVRIVLDTREVDRGPPVADRRALERADRMLRAARAGHVLCSEETAALLRGARDERAWPVDLGRFSIAGPGAPERLFHVRPADASWPDPPVAAGRAANPSLPLDLSRFFGRGAELALLRAELGSGGRRLVTVTGTGGMGKTRLALEAARGLLEAFHGAAWFVPLADLTDARDIPRAIAEALGLPPGPDALARLTDELAKRPTLLVLDNLEQLVPDAAALIGTLLQRASELHCLATSRERLGLEGERELPLEPLPLPEGPADPERVVASPSVLLFVERAQAVRPDFQVTRANARAVSDLVRRLEGIPLALALAGGRAQALSPEQILVRLSERLDLLVGRSRDAPPRHRTLRAAIEWSRNLLTAAQQRLFARLSVFRGGFAVEAVRDVCLEPEALDALVGLRECSLVLADRDSAEPRFRMLETLREHAREHVAAAERSELEERHARYFVALAARAAPELDGRDQGAWLGRLVAERDNLRAALDWSRSEPSRATLELELTGSLWRFWAIRGPIEEGQRRCAEALARSRGSTPARLKTLQGATTLASCQGDHETARSLGEETLALSEELGDRPRIARSLIQLGNVAIVAGHVPEARRRHEAALALARELGDTHLVSGELYNLGHILMLQGEYAAARRTFEESLAIAPGVEPMKAALAACDLGLSAIFTGDLAGARGQLEEALTGFRALGYRLGVATALRGLATAHERSRDDARARSLYEESLVEGRSEEVWAKASRALSLAGLARVSLPGSAALALVEEALALARENAIMRGHVLATVLADAGDLRRRAGDAAGARAAYEEALIDLAALGERCLSASCLEGLAALERARGKAHEAARLLAAAAAMREAVGTPPAPREAAWLESERAALLEALGRRAFERALREGRALPPAEAIARATATSFSARSGTGGRGTP
jgi:predicted ATPase/DNA-binding SARP family transcriptional activator